MMPGQDRVCFCSVLLSLHHGEEAGCGRPERRVRERWPNEDEAEGTKLYISVFTVFRKAVVL